jgi:hypothetical protein
MTLGFLTSWPVNRWLLQKGVKESMTVVTRDRPLTTHAAIAGAVPRGNCT